MYEMTPGRLAKELGVPKFEMWQTMQQLRINAKRMDARLSDSQDSTLRRYFANKRKDRERRAAQSSLRPLRTPVVPVLVERDFPRTCPCCDRRWVHRGVEDQAPTVCAACTDHRSVADEGIDRRLARAESHAELYKADRDAARQLAQQYHEHRQVAYESRAKWRAALAEVVLDHEEVPDGLCWCGHTIPCRTWLKLDEANRGIHRQVEKWSSWSEARLDDFLYGEDRASRVIIDEDEPEDDSESGAKSTG